MPSFLGHPYSRYERRRVTACRTARFTNQDAIPRNAAESRMKEFRPLELDTMHLEKGRGLLPLRATQIPGKTVMDRRRLTLTLRK